MPTVPPHPIDLTRLPVPGPEHVREFVALSRDKFGVEFESFEQATKAMTDILHLYYVLGGHLRRHYDLDDLVAEREPGQGAGGSEKA